MTQLQQCKKEVKVKELALLKLGELSTRTCRMKGSFMLEKKMFEQQQKLEMILWKLLLYKHRFTDKSWCLHDSGSYLIKFVLLDTSMSANPPFLERYSNPECSSCKYGILPDQNNLTHYYQRAGYKCLFYFTWISIWRSVQSNRLPTSVKIDGLFIICFIYTLWLLSRKFKSSQIHQTTLRKNNHMKS